MGDSDILTSCPDLPPFIWLPTPLIALQDRTIVVDCRTWKKNRKKWSMTVGSQSRLKSLVVPYHSPAACWSHAANTHTHTLSLFCSSPSIGVPSVYFPNMYYYTVANLWWPVTICCYHAPYSRSGANAQLLFSHAIYDGPCEGSRYNHG